MQEVKKHNVSFLQNRIAFTEKLPREEVRSRVAIVCSMQTRVHADIMVFSRVLAKLLGTMQLLLAVYTNLSLVHTVLCRVYSPS